MEERARERRPYLPHSEPVSWRGGRFFHLTGPYGSLTGHLTGWSLIKSPSLLGPYGFTGKMGGCGGPASLILIVIIIGCFPPPRPLPASRPGAAITCTHLHSSTAIYGYLRLSTHKISDPRDGPPPATNFEYLRLTATNCGFNKPKQSPPHGSRSAISVLS